MIQKKLNPVTLKLTSDDINILDVQEIVNVLLGE